MKKIVLAVACGITALSLSAQNLLKNPDFEEIVPAKLSNAIKKYLDAEEIPKGWSFNPPGNPSKFTVMTDAETSQKGSCYLRVEQKDPKLASSCTQWWLPVQGGKKHKLSVFAKGKGTILLQVIAYTGKKQIIKSFTSGKMQPVGADWKEYSFTVELPANAKLANIHFKMNGVVDLDNAAYVVVEGDLK